MLLLKNKRRITNILFFFLFTVIVVANSLFTVKQFHVLKQFDKIQMNFPIFTDSFVIVFLTSIQIIADFTVITLETLLVTFVTNVITNKKLRFSNFFSLITLANIFSIILNMIVISISGSENLQDLQWLSWSPSSQILLVGFIYLFLSNLDSSLSVKLKIKLISIIFAITYGFTFFIQLLMNIT